MKKIFTLLFSVGFLAVAANAQQGSRDNQQRDQRTGQQNRPTDNHQYDPKNDQQSGQWDKSNSYDNGKDLAGSNDRYGNSFYQGNIKMQIAQINRKYDLQVQRVRNDFHMRRFEKTRMIRSLEDKRQQEISMLYARSGNNRNQQHDPRRY